MKYLTREILTVTAGLVAAFLVLEHATGFSRATGAISSGYIRSVKALQGR